MLLFVYGQLMNPHKPYTLSVRGEMRARTKSDPAARFGSEYASKVFGQVLSVTKAQLARVQKFEKPQYALQHIGAYHGQALYSFADLRAQWNDYSIVESGKWRLKAGHEHNKQVIFG